MNATITLRDYLKKGKTFVIPSYQRGYVWGKDRTGENDSVTNFLDDIIVRYEAGAEIFLQGFTVTENDNTIVLIDGQQRTTCLYLLLKWLGYKNKFDIKYEVRKASDDFLRNLDISDIEELENENYQDIYFFKKTLRIMQNSNIVAFDKSDILEFLLDHIKFLYINIAEAQAVRVFTMMNGSKAKMLQEEIIKAEILRLSSQNNSCSINCETEWENNLLRNKYAREWDKWLHWWNRIDVKLLFGCNNPMGLLISSFSQGEKNDILTFEGFREKFLKKGEAIEAKKCFDNLRRLQKRFEDAFNNPSIHNMVGAILLIFNYENRNKFIKYFFVDDNRDNLKNYYLQAFLGMTHDEILKKETEAFLKKYKYTFDSISNDFAYIENKEEVFKLLLRLNIDQDSMQRRFFNFNIWNNRSLEHIYPKSKVKHEYKGKWYDGNDNEVEKDISMLDRDEITDGQNKTTEHSIGNLVLLYKNENSQFNSNDFNQKKRMFFSPLNQQLFKSRHLLHTICVFAEEIEWNGKSIAENKMKTLRVFESEYKYLTELYNEK